MAKISLNVGSTVSGKYQDLFNFGEVVASQLQGHAVEFHACLEEYMRVAGNLQAQVDKDTFTLRGRKLEAEFVKINANLISALAILEDIQRLIIEAQEGIVAKYHASPMISADWQH